MKALVLIPVVLAVVCGVGFALCKVAGWDPHLPQMVIAVVITALGSIAGAVPLIFVRNATHYAVSQAALLGTMAHMFVCAGLAAVIALGNVAGGLRLSLVCWLMACFVATLVVVAMSYIRTLRSARVETATASTAPSVQQPNVRQS